MRKFIAGIFAALILTLTACGADSGEVYAKDFIPEHIEYNTVQDYMPMPKYDPATGMTTVEQVWMGSHEEPYVEPDCYYVAFQNSEGDKGEDCIGKTRWDSITVGDFYEKG